MKNFYVILIVELATTLTNQKTVIRVVARGISFLWKVIVITIIFEYAVILFIFFYRIYKLLLVYFI